MPMSDRAFRIGISGSYGGLNLGDEAILQSIIAQFRAHADVEITVFTRNPEDTLRRHRVERAIAVRRLSRDEIMPEVERLDLFVLGGGGILYDNEAKVFLREVAIAIERDVPVYLYAVGAGPLHDASTQKAVRDCLYHVAAITVRERPARQELEAAGVHREIIVTADPALLLAAEPLPRETLKREGMDGTRCLIGMSVREPGPAAPDLREDIYHALLANAADFMVDRFNADIIFVPMERGAVDTQHSHAVIARMLRPERATVLKGEYTPGQLLALMRRFEFAVGMRLHFLIFAALQHVPFVALPYATKVRGLLDELGIEIPPIRLVNAGRLIAHIDHSWDQRSELKNRIARSLPALQRQAARSHQIALELLHLRTAHAVTESAYT